MIECKLLFRKETRVVKGSQEVKHIMNGLAAARAVGGKGGKKKKQTKAVMAQEASSLTVAGSLLVNVLPRMLRRTLRYAQTFQLATGAAGVVGVVQTMNISSIFDPDFSGGGHQPYGFDQLLPFYSYYLVTAVRYRMLVTTIGGTAEVGVVFQLFPSVGGVTVAGLSLDVATEKATCSTFPIGPSGNDRARLVEGRVQHHQVFGITPAQYKNEQSNYGAAMTTNPTANVYLEVGGGSYSGAAGTTFSVQIVLDFETEFFQPKTLPSS